MEVGLFIGLLVLFAGAVVGLVVIGVILRRRAARAQSRARYRSDDELSIPDRHHAVDIDRPGPPAAAATATAAAAPAAAAPAAAAPAAAAPAAPAAAPSATTAGPSTPAAGPSTAAAGLATIVTNSVLFVAQFTTAVVRR